MSLSLRPATEVQNWNLFVDRHPSGWWWHRMEWLTYQRFYRPQATDISVGVYRDRFLVGVVPLFIEHGTARIDGRPIPLYGSTEDAIEASALVTRHLCDHGARRWETAYRPEATAVPRPPLRQTRVIKVDRMHHELWREVRRSYHSLIHRAERQYAIQIHGAKSKVMLAAACAAVHQCAAGRVTRDFQTWSLMEQWVREGKAFVVSAAGQDGWVGFIYVLTYKDWAYYASGATVIKDVNHALQWTAIKAMPDYGVRYYEMGYLSDEPTDKERSIQAFKEGFGGSDWAFETRVVQLSVDGAAHRHGGGATLPPPGVRADVPAASEGSGLL